jgi:hypothetical protein
MFKQCTDEAGLGYTITISDLELPSWDYACRHTMDNWKKTHNSDTHLKNFQSKTKIIVAGYSLLFYITWILDVAKAVHVNYPLKLNIHIIRYMCK